MAKGEPQPRTQEERLLEQFEAMDTAELRKQIGVLSDKINEAIEDPDPQVDANAMEERYNAMKGILERREQTEK